MKTRPNTGEDPAQVTRIEPPLTDGHSPSTKTDPVSLPPAKPPEASEGLTQGTSAPSVATAKSASEDAHEEPAARAKPGDRGSPAKAEPGEIPKHKNLSATDRNFSTRARDGKTLPAPVSMVIPRYFAACEGTRSDFFSFITIPRV